MNLLSVIDVMAGTIALMVVLALFRLIWLEVKLLWHTRRWRRRSHRPGEQWWGQR